MSTVSEIAPVITAAHDALRRDFPLRPFAIRHQLAGHPLLTLLEPVRTTPKAQGIAKRTYVYATKGAPTVFTKFHARVADDPAWKVHSVDAGHGVMQEKPEETTAILLEAAL